MNTTKLKRFATEARNKLRQGVEKRLAMLGFDDAGIPAESPKLVSGGAVWKDKPCTVAFYNGFKSLEQQIRRYGVSHVVEEAAYTWFNRLMAIRILTMNELCEPVLRYVGSTRTPLIVDKARQGHLPEMDTEDREALMTLIDDDTKTAEQFAMLISAFCHNTPLIEKCFSIGNSEQLIVNKLRDSEEVIVNNGEGKATYSLFTINYYLDVVFPANILSENGFIDMLNTTDFITEEDSHSSELLGWLYQFYISEKKDQVFAKKGKYDADDIPAATQIFTPNWIVKYMVQNAVIPQVISYSEYRISEEDGKVIGDSEYCISKLRALKKKYKYLVLPPELDPEGHLSTIHSNLSTEEEDLSTIHYSLSLKKDLELLKVADLACGSGHILNECFDLLYDLYISEGYTRREAIECIFTQNLTGIDIDTRAKQLATFALMLKACQRDSSLVDASLMPHVYDMSGMPEESRELGSIQIFDEPDSDNPVIAALSTHYDAIVMNPPYMPTNKIDALSKYVNEHYKEGKADMFAVFMMVCMDRLKNGGRMGMINMQSWMFLSSFEALRKYFLKEYTLSSMLHLGPRTFDELSGEVVQNTAFVFSKLVPTESTSGIYYRLIDGKNCKAKEEYFFERERYYLVNQSNFDKIPGNSIGYWVSDNIIDLFSHSKISDLAAICVGIQTGDNDKYIHCWFEVDKIDLKFYCSSSEESYRSDEKWYPYNKGGNGFKWYGGNYLVVDWYQNGINIKNEFGSVLRNQNFYFKSCLTFPRIGSGHLMARFSPEGALFDINGPTLYPTVSKEFLLGYLNSKVLNNFLHILCPTLTFQVGDVGRAPCIALSNPNIDELVQDNIGISKTDWDAHETSWDFERNPLLAVDVQTYMNNIDAQIEKHRLETGETLCIDPAAPQLDSLKWRYEQYCQKWESLFFKLHANEEELNRRFIEIYGLQDELTPDIPLNEVTILQQGEISISDKEQLIVNKSSDDNSPIHYSLSPITFNGDVVMKQFISYAVGCMMGRYRLDRPGLAIAHPNETPEEVAEYPIPGTDEKFWIDDDGIIPLMSEDCGFHDNAVNRFATFVRQTLGDETQVENLNFIEECLGKSLEQYFIKDFWKDHKKMYQNRPIYWLFASKKGAFQVLVYVHRMNVATVERIRSRYLLPYIERLKKRIEDLQANESTLSTKQRNQLKTLRAQVAECEEYHNRLAVVAERGIVPNLDDGIIKNHALYGDIVTKIK